MTILNLQSKNVKQAGFTLIETLVAISILIVAITGAYGAAQTGFSGALYARDEVTAFYLAEEGVEEIRNIRDENGLNGRNWLAGISQTSDDPCYYGNGSSLPTKACYVDAITNVLQSCSSVNSCPVMKTDLTTGFYGYNTNNNTTDPWADTIFTRFITLKRISDNEVTLTVTVNWHKGLSQRSFHVKENIMNWQ